MNNDLVARLRDAHSFLLDPLLRESFECIEALEKALADIAVINNKRDRFSNEIDAIIYASKGTEE